jgi:hypothetical protein
MEDFQLDPEEEEAIFLRDLEDASRRSLEEEEQAVVTLHDDVGASLPVLVEADSDPDDARVSSNSNSDGDDDDETSHVSGATDVDDLTEISDDDDEPPCDRFFRGRPAAALTTAAVQARSENRWLSARRRRQLRSGRGDDVMSAFLDGKSKAKSVSSANTNAGRTAADQVSKQLEEHVRLAREEGARKLQTAARTGAAGVHEAFCQRMWSLGVKRSVVPLPHQAALVERICRKEGVTYEQRLMPAGAILAAPPGTGKTLLCIMAIMTARHMDATTVNRPPTLVADEGSADGAPVMPVCALLDVEVADPMDVASGEQGVRGGDAILARPALIVVPKNVLKQWENEILARTDLGASAVYVYYSKKSRNALAEVMEQGGVEALSERLAGVYFVLTTYETLAQEHRKCLEIQRIKYPPVALTMAELAVAHHDTLMTAEEAGLSRSIEPGESSGPSKPSRQRHGRRFTLAKSKVVKTVSMPYDERTPLLGPLWSSVWLDEAHMVRNAASQKAAACLDVVASRRYAITGSPFNNRVTDIISLCAFMRIRPYNLRKWWKTAHAIKQRKWRADYYLTADKRDLGLPDLYVHRVLVPLDLAESHRYLKFFSDAVVTLNTFLSSATATSTIVTTMIQRITRLRQATSDWRITQGRKATLPLSTKTRATTVDSVLTCSRCFLVLQEKRPTKRQKADRESLEAEIAAGLRPESDRPPPPAKYVATDCGHVSCEKCATMADAVCSLCVESTLDDKDAALTLAAAGGGSEPAEAMRPLSEKQIAANQAALVRSTVQHSSKTRAFLEQAHKVLCFDPAAKILVFSSSAAYLDILEHALRNRYGTDRVYERIDGSVNDINEREEIIARASGKPYCHFMLMLNSCGVGYNFHWANYVFEMDITYNPSLSDQNIDRAHRIGQTKNVHVYRFVSVTILGGTTIDGRMLQCQEEKRAAERCFLEKGNAIALASDADASVGSGLSLKLIKDLFRPC